MDIVHKFNLYERIKTILRTLKLDTDEYQRAIKQIADELGV